MRAAEVLQVRVAEGTSRKAKILAASKGMTQREYFDQLINREFEQYKITELQTA